MHRWWVAAIVVCAAALAAGLGVAAGWETAAAQPSLAYVTGAAGGPTAVWVANADGTGARRVGAGAQPLLAPDGSLIAASAQSGLRLYRTAGDPPRRYFGSMPVTATALAFSPDSRYLAVALSSRNPASAAASGLAVIDAQTFSARIIARGQIYGASFTPDGSDRIAYASAPTAALTAPVNIHESGPDGSHPVQITADGRSLNPVWGRRGIAFDREHLRHNAEPAYALSLMAADGTAARVIARPRIPPLRDGLVPLAFSADGSRLLANYVGQNTSQAWLVTLDGRAARLAPGVTGASLSRHGAGALLDRGGFLAAPDEGTVESAPPTGGRPRILVPHGSEPSWNA